MSIHQHVNADGTLKRAHLSGTALAYGLTDGDVDAGFQLGHRQWETWARMSNAQRAMANQLMAQRGIVASKAIAQARKVA